MTGPSTHHWPTEAMVDRQKGIQSDRGDKFVLLSGMRIWIEKEVNLFHSTPHSSRSLARLSALVRSFFVIERLLLGHLVWEGAGDERQAKMRGLRIQQFN